MPDQAGMTKCKVDVQENPDRQSRRDRCRVIRTAKRMGIKTVAVYSGRRTRGRRM
jgi:sugar phosphate isomerase/epimerase